MAATIIIVVMFNAVVNWYTHDLSRFGCMPYKMHAILERPLKYIITLTYLVDHIPYYFEGINFTGFVDQACTANIHVYTHECLITHACMRRRLKVHN